jgi:hypothetical protein
MAGLIRELRMYPPISKDDLAACCSTYTGSFVTTSPKTGPPEECGIEWRVRVEEIFHQVADLPGEARSQYFAEQHVEPAIQAGVEALLAFDSASDNSLDRDIGLVAERALV